MTSAGCPRWSASDPHADHTDAAVKFESYWLDSAPAFSRAAEGPLETRADVVVIGAGFTGLSAALALAKRGASVVVLDAGRVAGEASGRNGGHCNNGIAHDFSALAASQGIERARTIYKAFDAAVDAVEAIVREESIDCNFARGGKLKLAAKPAHYDSLARACEVLRREVDTDVEMVPASRIREEVDSGKFYGGMIQKKSAQMHMGKFAAGLADAAAARGAKIYEHAAVTRIERLGGDRHRLTTAHGVIEAAQVLVATGASRTGPLGWFRRRLVPIGSFIIVTEPLSTAVLDRIAPHRRSYVTTLNVGNYFRTTPDQRLLFGGRTRFTMSNQRSDEECGRILRETMQDVFPALKETRVDYCWGGLVDLTVDRLPRAGQRDGLYFSMGYSGHGVQMSVYMGRVMADVLAGRDAGNLWKGAAWPAIPGHFGDPWFLPLVGAYYRFQDLIH